MIPIIWRKDIKDEKAINYVGSIEKYSDIVEYFIDPLNNAKHIFRINLSFHTGTFKECEELFHSLFKQFLIDICKISANMLKPLQLTIRLENKLICGYVTDIEVFRAYRNTQEWMMKILPITIHTNSIEEGKKIMEEKLNLAIDNILNVLY